MKIKPYSLRNIVVLLIQYTYQAVWKNVKECDVLVQLPNTYNDMRPFDMQKLYSSKVESMYQAGQLLVVGRLTNPASQ